MVRNRRRDEEPLWALWDLVAFVMGLAMVGGLIYIVFDMFR